MPKAEIARLAAEAMRTYKPPYTLEELHQLCPGLYTFDDIGVSNDVRANTAGDAPDGSIAIQS